MNEITFRLPFPPSVNNYKKIGKLTRTKTGKLYQQRVNSDETKMYYFRVYAAYKPLKRLECSKCCFPEKVRLEVKIDFYPPHSHKRWDLDNRLKVLCDSLMYAKIIPDDSQIHCLIVQKMDKIEDGLAIVTIREI